MSFSFYNTDNSFQDRLAVLFELRSRVLNTLQRHVRFFNPKDNNEEYFLSFYENSFAMFAAIEKGGDNNCCHHREQHPTFDLLIKEEHVTEKLVTQNIQEAFHRDYIEYYALVLVLWTKRAAEKFQVIEPTETFFCLEVDHFNYRLKLIMVASKNTKKGLLPLPKSAY